MSGGTGQVCHGVHRVHRDEAPEAKISSVISVASVAKTFDCRFGFSVVEDE